MRKILSDYKQYYRHVIDLYEGYPYLTSDDLEKRSTDFVISCLGFGPIRIINFHGELFHTVVQEFQNKYSNNPVIIASYANGVTGYLLTADDFNEMGYEWTWALYAPEKIEQLPKRAFKFLFEIQ